MADLQRALQKWRLQRLLSGPFDRGGAVVSVQVRLMRRRLDMAAGTYLERGALASPLLLHPQQDCLSLVHSALRAAGHLQHAHEPPFSPSRHNRYWTCAYCRLGLGVWMPWTGPACWSACTCAGLRRRATLCPFWTARQVPCSHLGASQGPPCSSAPACRTPPSALHHVPKPCSSACLWLGCAVHASCAAGRVPTAWLKAAHPPPPVKPPLPAVFVSARLLTVLGKLSGGRLAPLQGPTCES